MKKKNVESLMSRAKEEMLNEQYQDAVVIYDKVLKIDSLNTVSENELYCTKRKVSNNQKLLRCTQKDLFVVILSIAKYSLNLFVRMNLKIR